MSEFSLRCPVTKYPAFDHFSEIFKPLHPPGVLDTLDPSQHLGPIDPTTIKPKAPRPLTDDEKRVRNAREQMPPIDAMINLYDFEKEAEKVLSKTAWAYYRSAANGEDSELGGFPGRFAGGEWC